MHYRALQSSQTSNGFENDTVRVLYSPEPCHKHHRQASSPALTDRCYLRPCIALISVQVRLQTDSTRAPRPCTAAQWSGVPAQRVAARNAALRDRMPEPRSQHETSLYIHSKSICTTPSDIPALLPGVAHEAYESKEFASRASASQAPFQPLPHCRSRHGATSPAPRMQRPSRHNGAACGACQPVQDCDMFAAQGARVSP